MAYDAATTLRIVTREDYDHRISVHVDSATTLNTLFQRCTLTLACRATNHAGSVLMIINVDSRHPPPGAFVINEGEAELSTHAALARVRNDVIARLGGANILDLRRHWRGALAFERLLRASERALVECLRRKCGVALNESSGWLCETTLFVVSH